MAQTVTAQQPQCLGSTDSLLGLTQFHQVGYQTISQSSSHTTVMRCVGADQPPQHATSNSLFHYTMPIMKSVSSALMEAYGFGLLQLCSVLSVAK